MTKTIKEYGSDSGLAVLVDLYRLEMESVTVFQGPGKLTEVVKTVLRKKPAGDFYRSFEAIARLIQPHLSEVAPKSLGKLRSKYLERAVDGLTKAYEADRSRAELDSAVRTLSGVIEAIRELETREK